MYQNKCWLVSRVLLQVNETGYRVVASPCRQLGRGKTVLKKKMVMAL